jgi:hypothetical protein
MTVIIDMPKSTAKLPLRSAAKRIAARFNPREFICRLPADRPPTVRKAHLQDSGLDQALPIKSQLNASSV